MEDFLLPESCFFATGPVTFVVDPVRFYLLSCMLFHVVGLSNVDCLP
jgi:hypothetical protein